jgi:hypothetical protein
MNGIAKIGIMALAAALLAARPDAKADLKAAAKKLEDAGGYAWTSVSKSEGGGGGGNGNRNRFQPGPVEGKLDKDSLVWIKTTQGDNSTEAFLKAGKSVVKTGDGWKAGSEFDLTAQGGQGRRDPAMGLVRRLQNFKAPAAEAGNLIEKLGDVKDEGDGVFSSTLSEDGAKELLTRNGRPGGNGNGPQVTDPKASVKMWLKDGVLVKYELNTQGKMSFNNNEFTINRTTTVEFKEIGAVTIEVPEEAKKKLE